VDIKARGVDPVFDPQRLPGCGTAFELFPKFFTRLDLRYTAQNDRKLFVNRWKGHGNLKTLLSSSFK
jgi:hypothetical protein